ncbi:MAG TPA: hypothetical protein DDY29_08460 [Rhodobacteraceae bacterium]|mgnify:CR=1 FL=1|jgi:hypothetical protein|nr:hypothetical protein [Paracoccaceae bacterium]HBG98741.1 hypothetical protein [Paracoccaceae bacterium]
MFSNRSDSSTIMNFNLIGVIVSYALLALSLYLSPDVPLSTKGYWGIGILLLTLSLVNWVKYRFDAKLTEDRLQRLEEAKTEKMLHDYVSKDEA